MYGAFGHVSLKSVSKFDLPLNYVYLNVLLLIEHYLFSKDTQVSFEQSSKDLWPTVFILFGKLIDLS